jgi:putative tricarboxylic transport membrane protein
MWGLQPGPLLMDQNPEFAWGLIASMYLGNVMLLLVNIFCIPAFASIARVPFRILAPIILVVCIVGTFTVNGSIIEVGIMLVCGVLGFFMRRYGLSPAALVIALVLGPMGEETLRQTLLISDGSWGIFLERTTSIVLLAAMAFIVLIPLLMPPLRRALRTRLEVMGQKRRQRTGRPGDTAAVEGDQADGEQAEGEQAEGEQGGPVAGSAGTDSPSSQRTKV